MREELEKYYSENFNKLCKVYARRAGSPEAGEDIVQEGFAIALQYLNSYNPKYNNFKAWMDRVLMTAFRSYRNSERMQGATTELDEELIEQDELRLIDSRLLVEIQALIDKKSKGVAEVLDLFFIKGYTPEDIREITGLKRKAIYQNLFRFREEVKNLYETSGVR